MFAVFVQDVRDSLIFEKHESLDILGWMNDLQARYSVWGSEKQFAP